LPLTGFLSLMNIIGLPSKAISFLKEVRIELKRVTWPTRQDTIKYTLIVIGFSLAVAAFLGGLDFLFTWLLEKFVI
jgi:preprotein translocase subunit SecE